ncbi:MAG: cell envelope biogenesis protein OmpA [Croceicoccus sp.]|nr:cell envelope biogenesis protein OmpA [Croceicoccus sp.]MAL25724.1 cell envelope biogenesis protein OmpA [Croceicoccus sp.]
MNALMKTSKAMLLLATTMLPVSGLAAQDMPAQDMQAQGQAQGDTLTTAYGPQMPAMSEMTAGPDLDGIISARSGDRIQITAEDGTKTVLTVTDETRIKSSGGFLGLNKDRLAANELLNGIPVSVETLQWDGGLVAGEIDLKKKDLKTAEMIYNATDQRFGDNELAIQQNAAATEALRGRFGDIDKYNVKNVTNVNFATGKYNLSEQDKALLCNTASQADAMENALLLVVGYTDSTGSQEFNQVLSEKRAARVVNHLQQACGWKPYRMLTPTGMAEADPMADNSTPEGKAQNRRVAVNVLVSKAVDEM